MLMLMQMQGPWLRQTVSVFCLEYSQRCEGDAGYGYDAMRVSEAVKRDVGQAELRPMTLDSTRVARWGCPRRLGNTVGRYIIRTRFKQRKEGQE